MYQAAVLNKSKVNPYLADQILNATPEQLLLKAYDYAVVHSEKKDMIKTNRAIQVLTGFLRFDDESYSELSQRLLRLYQFCEEQTRKNNFEIVTKILSELRESWLNAVQNKQVA
ncbi:MAG: flagellar protein FliS [Ignavibacteriota bacterium]|jgi:flagellar protein FliS|nr:flagellar protein FliS [Ignavibacteriota bacterium]MBW7841531.1 flagellar protein FliS [Ignavibacterium sp.]MCO6448250.1 flagellar protein FliS [Ignavibacterium album]MCZ2268034.1 flagellar protein FliS [Ignavibacteriales bacterium]MDX9711462.1 flagellar protein FliS [Ignavibacteriaceae bacterium]